MRPQKGMVPMDFVGALAAHDAPGPLGASDERGEAPAPVDFTYLIEVWSDPSLADHVRDLLRGAQPQADDAGFGAELV